MLPALIAQDQGDHVDTESRAPNPELFRISNIWLIAQMMFAGDNTGRPAVHNVGVRLRSRENSLLSVPSLVVGQAIQSLGQFGLFDV